MNIQHDKIKSYVKSQRTFLRFSRKSLKKKISYNGKNKKQ